MFDCSKLIKLNTIGDAGNGEHNVLRKFKCFFNGRGSIDIVAGIVALVGFYLLKPKPQEYYCAACGQYLGQQSEGMLERCGCNRSTTQDPGPKR
jgi:hypothetical protein